MDRQSKTIVVMGATGRQGGAVARNLLKNGWTVRAVVRNPNKDAARALAEQGAGLVQGDMNDRASLDRTFHGAYGAFSVQNFWLPEVGFEKLALSYILRQPVSKQQSS